MFYVPRGIRNAQHQHHGQAAQNLVNHALACGTRNPPFFFAPEGLCELPVYRIPSLFSLSLRSEECVCENGQLLRSSSVREEGFSCSMARNG